MISTLWRSLRFALPALIAAATWLETEQAAHAQALVAQTGAAKTGIGYGLFFLAVVLGLLAICRPSSRQWQYTEQELREQQAKKQGQVRR
ncbi:MAG TPA: hypothetical protein VMP01_00075 [Pirellulaceae bacterium]|nr:hypothetical protein [Pirellulaceae bacterium]